MIYLSHAKPQRRILKDYASHVANAWRARLNPSDEWLITSRVVCCLKHTGKCVEVFYLYIFIWLLLTVSNNTLCLFIPFLSPHWSPRVCRCMFCFQGSKAHAGTSLSSRRQMSECLCYGTWLDPPVVVVLWISLQGVFRAILGYHAWLLHPIDCTHTDCVTSHVPITQVIGRISSIYEVLFEIEYRTFPLVVVDILIMS